jgi:uncharacterized LabA/DUF88 family protein
MSRIAVFVDAGYLFAQGSAALTGEKKPRAVLDLNQTAVLAELTNVAQTRSGKELLRVYWYDAPPGNRGPTAQHIFLANTDHIKLRLGFMNSRRQQKGVDSLIVTDLIELARNHAISDALLISGDEDVRVGVQIAQSLGVRLHLLGIVPCRGSQSPQLMQEADTTTEWDAATVGRFLSVKPLALAATATVQPPPQPAPFGPVQAVMPPDLALIEKVAQAAASALDTAHIQSLQAFWQTGIGLPYEHDSRLIATCRTEIGRDLSQDEKRLARRKFKEAVPKGS